MPVLKCYKCGTVHKEPGTLGFQDVCEGCQSYLHCCMNCRFFDEYAEKCAEPQAEFVSDRNGMNHCEYFQPHKRSTQLAEDLDDAGRNRRRLPPDWRNVKKGEKPLAGPMRGAGRSNPFGGGGHGGGDHGGRRSRNPFGDSGGRGDRAQKARDALEKLFKKPEE